MDAESMEEVHIMKELPHRLRREVAYAVNKKFFKQLFHDFTPKDQMTIASMMMPLQVRYAKGSGGLSFTATAPLSPYFLRVGILAEM